MTSTAFSRPGDTNLASTPLSLFLKVFANEVLLTFEELNVMRNVVQTRSIPYGKSATFPVMGRASAGYHTAGVSLTDTGNGLLNTIAANEKLIYVDNKLVAPVMIFEMDEIMNHYDVRGPYASALGQAIAKRYDQLAINTAVLAARASATITGLNGGSVITDTNMALQGSALSTALFLAAQKLDEKDVPKEDRFAVVSPAMYYNLIRDPSITISTAAGIASNGFPLLNTSLNGPNGSYSQAVMHQVAGINLLVSNHIPATNIASNDSFFGTGAASANGNVYYGDFSKTKGLVFHKSAIGVLKVRDIRLEAEYKVEYQGHLIVAKMVTGMGTLRPEAAIELALP